MQPKSIGLLIVGLLVIIGGTVLVNGVGADLSESPVDEQLSQTQVQTQTQTQQLHNTSFGVEDLSAPESATAGETITVSANVTNPATVPMIQFVEFRLAGDVVARTAFALNPGETETVTFDINTTGVAPGTYVHSVQTQDHGEVATIELTEPQTETPTETTTETETETTTTETETETTTTETTTTA